MCSDSIFNLLKRVTDGSFLIFMRNIIFSFSTFLVFRRPNQVSLKLVYRPQISSRSALENSSKLHLFLKNVCQRRVTRNINKLCPEGYELFMSMIV